MGGGGRERDRERFWLETRREREIERERFWLLWPDSWLMLFCVFVLTLTLDREKKVFQAFYSFSHPIFILMSGNSFQCFSWLASQSAPLQSHQVNKLLCPLSMILLCHLFINLFKGLWIPSRLVIPRERKRLLARTVFYLSVFHERPEK